MRFSIVLTLTCLLFALPVVAAPIIPPAAVPPSVTPVVKPAALNGISTVAANAGVRTCLERFEQTSNFIIANTQSKAFLFLPPTDVDRQINSVSFEVELQNKSVAYATMTTAPTTGGGCDSLYETVVYWSAGCAEVATNSFPKAKPIGVVQQYIQVLQGGPNLNIFLMPAGAQGCVSIKKEVVY